MRAPSLRNTRARRLGRKQSWALRHSNFLGLIDIVLFGVMPEGAVTHPEKFRRTCSYTATGVQCRHDIGSFGILHVLYKIDSALWNLCRATFGICRGSRNFSATLGLATYFLRQDSN